jgi:hypothetical protein
MDCRKYIIVTMGDSLLYEAKSSFEDWCETLPLPKKLLYEELIALPGKQNSKPWRDALRSVLLLEVILNEGSPTPHKTVIDKAKKEFGGCSETQLQSAVRTRLNVYSKKVNRPAITAFRDAADQVLRKYGNSMEGCYGAALRAVFIQGNVNAPDYLFCMRWHKTELAWMQRVNEIGRKFGNTGGKTGATESALTMSWGTIKEPAVDIVNKHAPFNRVIEIRDPNEIGTLIHEILHWVTHKSYQDAVNLLDGNERRFVHEGATEWLKRNLTGNWANGGYGDVFESFDDFVVKSGAVVPNDIQRAYFSGTNVTTVITALRQVFKNKEVEIFKRGMAGKDLSKVLGGVLGK